MSLRRSAQFLGAGALIASGMAVGTTVPTASAEPCPDVEIVFARGTSEAPGVGGTGQAFVDAVRAQTPGKSVAVYPVNYPASDNFGNRIAFAQTVVDGIRDAGARVESMSKTCPDTKMVLGGFSQGAVVAGYVTADAIPDGIPPEYLSELPKPLPDDVADHVAAVVLLGNPSDAFLSQFGAPIGKIGPLYEAKTLELCAPGDTICDGSPGGIPSMAHVMYPMNGMATEAAAFAVSKV
ncbi:cutinase family protein [Mycolicibacterium diernhoferi]|uniref:Cutinase family protein n=4 Tax=Mycolicibacterium diernhoferi TaxID=1801 RepID=A0A1Q4HJS6_9MYCO|nr:cutinase family protein [Mycolicibacterium diernhoferi]OJZ67798.1 cutinase family protein [Mycolicibacterium diernhoferi]PEG51854.1 cutinase family protein [Mycolicibacterium diernhoferi]QYL20447.1 cutinase family protein [Mycolicibacterium diernhoferi]